MAAQTSKRATAPSRARPGFNDSESPIAWLRRRKDKDGRPMISSAQFDAGERLRAEFCFAQMTPRITMNWSDAGPMKRGRRMGTSGGVELLDNVAAARERVRQALAVVGPELAGVLVDVCCHLKGLEESERNAGWPQRSGKVVLQLALTRLARHYGLIEDEGRAGSGGSRCTRHWGSEDYRPLFDLPAE